VSKPRFLFDENIPRELGLVAHEEGFDVAFIVDLAPGRPDHDVLATGFREKRVVVTEDTDFGRLVFSARAESRGVILIRIDAWKRELRRDRFRWLLRENANRVEHHFTVLRETSLRIRPIDRNGH
jgi:predicted nuclease of predicted toxin-antitoxin system